MADKNSTIRFNPPQLKRAPYAVRLSLKVREPEQVSIISARPAPSSVSSAVTNASDSKSRSSVTAQPDAPRAQNVQPSRTTQTPVLSSVAGRNRTVKTTKQELVERLKSPEWMISNPRQEHFSKELKDAVSSLISLCRMLEKIGGQLNGPPFKSERERQHVDFLSKRLLKSWAAFSMALEGYYDDEGWARSVISRTAFDMMEIVSDLQALLACAGKVVDLQGKCRECDSDDNLPQYWLTKDAISRYQGVERELIAAMHTAQQLNETFSRMPAKKKAGVRLGNVVSVLPAAGSTLNPVQRTGKRLFQQKNRSELESLNKQASSIYVCLGDLGNQLQLVELRRQFVVNFLDDSATLLKDTMQHAKTIRSWETGLHRSRHHFLKAHAKLQDIASVTSTLQVAELAIAQKIAAGIYASFDSVINIMLNLASDGVTDIQATQKRQEIPSSPAKTISSPTTVTRRYIPDNLNFPQRKPEVSVQVGKAPLQQEREDALAKVVSSARSPTCATGQMPASMVVPDGRSTSTISRSQNKKANAGELAAKLAVAWQEIENGAKTSKQSSN